MTIKTFVAVGAKQRARIVSTFWHTASIEQVSIIYASLMASKLTGYIRADIRIDLLFYIRPSTNAYI